MSDQMKGNGDIPENAELNKGWDGTEKGWSLPPRPFMKKHLRLFH